MPSCTTGVDDAVYVITSGGTVPAGSPRSTVWHIAVTCVSAIEMLTVGWKKILITAFPYNDCDS